MLLFKFGCLSANFVVFWQLLFYYILSEHYLSQPERSVVATSNCIFCLSVFPSVHSFILLTFIKCIIIPSQQHWRGYSNGPFMCGWVSEWMRDLLRLLCGHDTDWFLLVHFQTSHVFWGWWEEEPYWFLVMCSKFKVNFGALCTSHVSWIWWEEEPYCFGVAGSNVKVNFCTLCIKPCWPDADCSFCLIIFILHMLAMDDNRRNPIDFGSHLPPCNSLEGDIVMQPFMCHWVSEMVHEWVHRVCGTIQTTIFARSLSNFTCKLRMMRGGTLLILGCGVKGQGQLLHSVY